MCGEGGADRGVDIRKRGASLDRQRLHAAGRPLLVVPLQGHVAAFWHVFAVKLLLSLSTGGTVLVLFKHFLAATFFGYITSALYCYLVR